MGGSGIREFPGRIDANRQAELDKTNYQIAVNNQQAQFDNAEKNYRRAEDLISCGAVSRMDFDRMEANLEAARQNLAHTSLRTARTDGECNCSPHHRMRMQ